MSPAQETALHLLACQRLTGRDARRLLGETHGLTLPALARRGLVTCDEAGRWLLTPKGARKAGK